MEKYLVLNKYLLSLFGAKDFKDFQDKMKDVSGDIDSDGRSNFINSLRSSFNTAIPEEVLLIYDENIQSYVKKINYKRELVSLKYFQYIAVLFSEIVLDNLKNRKQEFIYRLNEFLKTYENGQEIKDIIEPFTEKDLKKLAFWMATGSGKTLIGHINYYQFMQYGLFAPNNILFITPNAGLSEQHSKELQKSGIPCTIYSGSLNGGFKNKKEILVIEMTKFVGKKKGGGVTLPVEIFEGPNLVFVDEGHKGKKSEEQKWAKLRNTLAENGFVFEYSATFGQILSESNKATLQEYAKSILFDYSYKYFYLDGYGKDFSVVNVKRAAAISEKKFQETMFVANLLSFYEQVLVYGQNKQEAKAYNLEKPLWIFVGTTVTGKEEESDVVNIVGFINKVISEEEWLQSKVRDILEGNTGLKDENNNDVFRSRFGYIREERCDFNKLYKNLFGGRGSLYVYEIKNADGEFGIKVGENDYCGVINIGDISGFKKQLEKNGIVVGSDAMSPSLFDSIKKESSSVNILIGAKKFIEGWDTWRVSSMGLLNIGTGQGPQIIQLFGRGVRLKGKGMSLKRSQDKTIVNYLENLNIYGIKADYLDKFLDAIRKEDIEYVTIDIPVQTSHEEKWHSLSYLAKDTNKDFSEENFLRLEIDDTIYYKLDLLPKVLVHSSEERTEEGLTAEQAGTQMEGTRLPEDVMELFNWSRICNEIYDFTLLKNYWNLVFDRGTLQAVLASDQYEILALPDMMDVRNYEDIQRLEDIALLVIKKYIERFYRKYASRFETGNMHYKTFDKKESLSLFEWVEGKHSYKVTVEQKEKKLVEKIKQLSEDLHTLLIEDDNLPLPRIFFDNHLYVPILLQNEKIKKITPEGLVDSEKKFVLGIRKYIKSNAARFKDYELYLLRNYPKSGVGFHLQHSGFYPDFIMWVKKGTEQKMIFIDPKGLEHSKGLGDDKIVFAGTVANPGEIVTIKKIEEELNRREGTNITMESFILAKGSYNEFIKDVSQPPPKERCEQAHLLFMKGDTAWPEKFFNMIL